MNPLTHTSPPPPPPPLPPLLFRPSSVVVAAPKPDRAMAAAAVDAAAIPPCSECGRRFPSWKALFGHMRCHPERHWRGINPPPHFRHRIAPSAAAAAAAANADADADAYEFTEEEREVAASLVMLAGPPRRRRRPRAAPRHGECCSRCSKVHKRGVCTNSKACVIDLNMPPPPPYPPRIESGEGVSSTTLDLRLGI